MFKYFTSPLLCSFAFKFISGTSINLYIQHKNGGPTFPSVVSPGLKDV
jgi:hypothetical protein